ncbi:hypothetical protein VTH06DRAFT_4193 [Thermothelomyces fergusii]
MKPAALLASALLSTAVVWAAPASKNDDDDDDKSDSSKSEIDPHHGYVNHEGHTCEIIDAAEVNCRSGPGLDFEPVTTLKKGFKGTFTCVQTGECIVIDGFKNCGWDRIYIMGVPCYVSGQYTDKDCGAAKLGFCEGG